MNPLRRLLGKKQDSSDKVKVVSSNKKKQPKQEPLGTNHSEKTRVIFQRFKQDEPLQTNYEQHRRHGDSFAVTNDKSKIITAGGRFVKPSKLVGLCDECNDADSKLYICAYTGNQLCRKCMVVFNGHADGPIPLCSQAYAALNNSWDSWSSLDHAMGLNDWFDAEKIFPFYRQAMEAWNKT